MLVTEGRRSLLPQADGTDGTEMTVEVTASSCPFLSWCSASCQNAGEADLELQISNPNPKFTFTCLSVDCSACG